MVKRRGYRRAAVGIPNPGRMVKTAGDDPLTVRAEAGGNHGIGVFHGPREQRAGFQIPSAGGAVTAGGHQPLTICAELH